MNVHQTGSEEIDAKGLEDLGEGEKLLVVDDAHDRGDLSQLMRYAAIEGTHTRLLLVYRPYWTDVVRREVAGVGLIGEHFREVRVEKPTKKDAIALASQVLTKYGASSDLAVKIADIAYDSPLAVVVGAQIVAKEGVHPELFRSNEEFSATVLKRYEQMIADGIAKGKDKDRVYAMLRVLALIQPVVPDDRHVIELLATLEGIEAPDASRLARLLIDSGVLFKRGAAYRLSPDLLADSIIETACITSNGDSNGYAEQVFNAAIPEHKEHVLLNLGRLDWRRNEGDTSASHLLDEIWSKLEWEDGYLRAQVKAAASAAYYQPRQALDFASRLIEQGHGADADVCRIIHDAAYSFEHLLKACELLWEVGKGDARPTNQYPDHPLRLLTELAAPEPRKPIEYCETVVEFALSLLPYNDSWIDVATPFDILETALATEGDFTLKATSRKITFSAFGVNFESVVSMRKRIINAILESITHGKARRAYGAAKLLESAVRGPIGRMNREPTDREQAIWSMEFVDTLTRLNAVLDANRLPAVILVRLGQSVSWHAHFAEGETNGLARRILDRLDRDLETRVTRVLMDGWGHTWDLDSIGIEHNEQRQVQLAAEVEAAYPNVVELAQFLDNQLVEMDSYREDLLTSADRFINRLIEGQLGLAREIFDAWARGRQSLLARFGSFALASLLRHTPEEAHERINALLVKGEGDLTTIAQAYSFGTLSARQINDNDRDVIRRIFNSSDKSVLGCASWIFREIVDKDKQFAIELLVNANPALTRVARVNIFMWLDDDKYITLDSISEENLERIIQLLVTPNRLDEHHIYRFLARVAKRNPRRVLELVKIRLERACAEGNWEYLPIGRSRITAKSFNILEHPDGAAMFRENLDWAMQRSTGKRFLRLFAAIIDGAFGFTEPLFTSTLETWSAEGNAAYFTILAAVLGEVPPQFVFDEHAFVQRILRAARSISKSAHKEVGSALYASATGGMRSGTPGQPFQADIELKENAEKVLLSLSRANPAYDLYNALLKYATGSIDRSLAEGRAMDEEDEDA